MDALTRVLRPSVPCCDNFRQYFHTFGIIDNACRVRSHEKQMGINRDCERTPRNFQNAAMILQSIPARELHDDRGPWRRRILLQDEAFMLDGDVDPIDRDPVADAPVKRLDDARKVQDR